MTESEPEIGHRSGAMHSSSSSEDEDDAKVKALRSKASYIKHVRKAAEPDWRVDFTFVGGAAKDPLFQTVEQPQSLLDHMKEVLTTHANTESNTETSTSILEFANPADGKLVFPSVLEAVACQVATYAVHSRAKKKNNKTRTTWSTVYPNSIIVVRDLEPLEINGSDWSAVAVFALERDLLCTWPPAAAVAYTIPAGRIGIYPLPAHVRSVRISTLANRTNTPPLGVVFTIPSLASFKGALRALTSSAHGKKKQEGKSDKEESGEDDRVVATLRNLYLARRVRLKSSINLGAIQEADKCVVLQSPEEFMDRKSKLKKVAEGLIRDSMDYPQLALWIGSSSPPQESLGSQLAILGALGVELNPAGVEAMLVKLSHGSLEATLRLIPPRFVMTPKPDDCKTREDVLMAIHRPLIRNLTVLAAFVSETTEAALLTELHRYFLPGLQSLTADDRGRCLPILGVCWTLLNLATIDVNNKSAIEEKKRPYQLVISEFPPQVSRFLAVYYWTQLNHILLPSLSSVGVDALPPLPNPKLPNNSESPPNNSESPPNSSESPNNSESPNPKPPNSSESPNNSESPNPMPPNPKPRQEQPRKVKPVTERKIPEVYEEEEDNNSQAEPSSEDEVSESDEEETKRRKKASMNTRSSKPKRKADEMDMRRKKKGHPSSDSEEGDEKLKKKEKKTVEPE